jgi:hypothetical protein
VLLDGAPPRSSHGDDADEEWNGELRDGRLSGRQLVENGLRQRSRMTPEPFVAMGAGA